MNDATDKPAKAAARANSDLFTRVIRGDGTVCAGLRSLIRWHGENVCRMVTHVDVD